MTTTSIPLEATEEGRAFLQYRVGRFGLYGFCLGAFFVLLRLSQSAWFGALAGELDVSLLLHVLAAGSLLAVWLVCHRGRRTPRFLRLTESLGLFLACTLYSAMGLYLPPFAQPHYIVILALALGIIARSVYVPSSRRRTTWLTILCGLPLFVSTFLMYYDMDLAPWKGIAPGLEKADPVGLAWATLIWTMGWWAGVITLCAGASGVIYGLRKEVRSARKLGQYTLEEKIGEGGMGMVYAARHAMLRRPTAVKLLPAEKAGAEQLVRFEREVQLTAMLTHPNTVTVFDYGRTPDGVFYYAMEYLDGATLQDVVEVDGPQPPARVAYILSRVAGALAEAHEVGLMHRDVKPANIMLVEQGGKPDIPKVLDFGLVKEMKKSEAASLTQADVVTGTPQYMPPEALSAPDSIDARSDLYSLGAVTFCCSPARSCSTAPPWSRSVATTFTPSRADPLSWWRRCRRIWRAW
jgi:hypothetical protein